ncbi:GntR family transcriptional regulator [Microterricola pindariensis]|uniref:GntR family transcriptional regulator n=1 Tax=Microterricola pindariensis TaxID=478010 RepID=A0ABX5AYF9_9MICO|nr:GntR family transcriptional regulator [Microterricola pindariensis]PPL19676.1 GntR family transcriptional regulator [Microterricola pindariensis]
MELPLKIDKAGSTPPFEQLRMQLLAAVQNGALPAGTRLPTVRALAGQLEIAVNTVASSYRALEKDGVIETRGRSGSFVAATGDPTTAQLQLAARAFAERAGQLGVAPRDALAAVRAALDAG